MNAPTLPFADLLGEPVRAAAPLSPGYEDHANDIWRIITDTRAVVVRVPRPEMGDPRNPFWAGARLLFGHDPRDPTPIGPLHDRLRDELGIPAPRVLASGTTEGCPWLATESLPGSALPDLADTPDTLVIQLGAWLARLHHAASDHWGDLAGRRREPLATFTRRLAETVETLTMQFHAHDAAYIAAMREVLARIAFMPAPNRAVPVMLDIDPTQFLHDGECLTGLIDTDAVVLGPPALELIAVEPLLDTRTAAAFKAGYGPLPALDAVRPIYRFLTLLMEVQGDPPLDEWMEGPPWLGAGGDER